MNYADDFAKPPRPWRRSLDAWLTDEPTPGRDTVGAAPFALRVVYCACGRAALCKACRPASGGFATHCRTCCPKAAHVAACALRGETP